MAEQTIPARTSGGLTFLDSWWRIGGALGIVFIIVFLAGAFISGETPTAEDTPAEAREYFVDDGNAYLVSDGLTGIAIVFFFLPFAAAVRGVLAGADRSGGMWSMTWLIGALLFAAIGGAASMSFGALAWDGAEGWDDGTIQGMLDMNAYAFMSLPLAAGLMVGAASIVIVRTGVFWRWLGYAGLVILVLAMVGSFAATEGDDEGALTFMGFIVLPLTALWILAASIQMVMRSTPYEQT
jgi:hypothetical protein